MPDLPLLLNSLPANAARSLREFALLQQLSRAGPGPAVAGSLKALRQFRPRARSWILGHTIARIKREGLQSTLKRLSSLSGAKISVSLNALHGNIDAKDFSALLASYLNANVQEAAHMGELSQFRRAIYENKATAIATAILRTSTKSHLDCSIGGTCTGRVIRNADADAGVAASFRRA